MTAYILHEHAERAGRWAHAAIWLKQAVSAAAGTIGKEVRCRRAIRELRTLDRHMLADIGIGASEIESAVYGGRDELARMLLHA